MGTRTSNLSTGGILFVVGLFRTTVLGLGDPFFGGGSPRRPGRREPQLASLRFASEAFELGADGQEPHRLPHASASAGEAERQMG